MNKTVKISLLVTTVIIVLLMLILIFVSYFYYQKITCKPDYTYQCLNKAYIIDSSSPNPDMSKYLRDVTCKKNIDCEFNTMRSFCGKDDLTSPKAASSYKCVNGVCKSCFH